MSVDPCACVIEKLLGFTEIQTDIIKAQGMYCWYDRRVPHGST